MLEGWISTIVWSPAFSHLSLNTHTLVACEHTQIASCTHHGNSENVSQACAVLQRRNLYRPVNRTCPLRRSDLILGTGVVECVNHHQNCAHTILTLKLENTQKVLVMLCARVGNMISTFGICGLLRSVASSVTIRSVNPTRQYINALAVKCTSSLCA